MTKIWTEMQDHGDYLEVQVNIQDAPTDFLGTSFHLKFNGLDLSQWNYELGSVFGETSPFVLVGEKDNALVTGLSFQRGNQAVIQDGDLITFYVQVEDEEEIALSFDYPVLSRFEHGRKDVEGVEWVGSTIQMSEKVEQKPEDDETVQSFREDNEEKVFQASTLTYPPDGLQARSVGDVYMFMFGFGSFLCAIAGLIYLYYRYRKTML